MTKQKYFISILKISLSKAMKNHLTRAEHVILFLKRRKEPYLLVLQKCLFFKISFLLYIKLTDTGLVVPAPLGAITEAHEKEQVTDFKKEILQEVIPFVMEEGNGDEHSCPFFTQNQKEQNCSWFFIKTLLFPPHPHCAYSS